MLRKLHFSAFAVVTLLILICGSSSFAQAPTPVVGDYGSVASGNFSALSTWKQWDGSGWNTTPTGGPGSSKQVFILTGTTVIYDVGSQNCKNLIVQAGATFKSDSVLPCSSGSLMPLKVNGPTVWVDGNLGGGPKDALVLETKYSGVITLEGSGIVNVAQLRPNSGQSGTLTFVFGMNANINYAGVDSTGGPGIYTQRGTQTSVTITVNAGDTVSFAKRSNFMINSNPQLNGLMNTVLNVNGVLNDSGTVVLADSSTATAALNVGSAGRLIIRGGSLVQSLNSGNTATVTVNGTYEHAMDGGVLPTATWNVGSTCFVTGLSDSNLTGANQNFYNFAVDCDSLTQPSVPVHFDMQNNTIAGNLTIHNTNGKYLALTGFDTPGPKTITVNGNFSVNSISSFVAIDDYASSHPAEIVKLNIKGNLSITDSSSLGLSAGSAPNLIDIFLSGNLLAQAGASFFSHSGTHDSLFFVGTGIQSYTAGALSNGNRINWVVMPGAILDMDTSAFQGSASTFALDSSATLKTSHLLGLNGNLTLGGGTTLSSGGSYQFYGDTTQVTGSLIPATLRNLTVNNSKGVTLSRNIAVTGALALTSGRLLLDTNAVIAASVTGGSATNYLSTDSAKSSLTIPAVGSTETIFPVGTAHGYAPVWITNPGSADTFSVSVKPDSGKTTNGLGRVNVRWNIAKSHYSGSSFTLQFGWMASEEDSVFAHNRSSYATIYLVTDTSVNEEGSGNYATQFANQPYTVSRSGITAGINGGTTSYGTTFVVGHFTTTGIEEQQGVPIVFKLSQNYPNPFNPTTKIEFTVAKKGNTTLRVYNVIGQQVATLFSGDAKPGTKYSVDFNGSLFASGVYFSVLESDGQRQIQKMVLMK